MIYTVLGGTLNPTHSFTHWLTVSFVRVLYIICCYASSVCAELVFEMLCNRKYHIAELCCWFSLSISWLCYYTNDIWTGRFLSLDLVNLSLAVHLLQPSIMFTYLVSCFCLIFIWLSHCGAVTALLVTQTLQSPSVCLSIRIGRLERVLAAKVLCVVRQCTGSS